MGFSVGGVSSVQSGVANALIRTVVSSSSSVAAGSVAYTDYIYYMTGTVTVTLPTAVGNSNGYTVKNVNSGVVTIAFTSAQTGDGSSTIALGPNDSISLTSDGSNYNIV